MFNKTDRKMFSFIVREALNNNGISFFICEIGKKESDKSYG